MTRVELAFLWHMHQPPYREPIGGEYILPWVRLHATRAYLDMAAIHERFPEVRGTVNLVPSLLAQLEDYAEERARDRFLALTERPAADLDEAARVFLLRNFFMVGWEHNVLPRPRYRELLHKRGRDPSRVDLAATAATFTTAELRDLQVHFNLAWMGFAAAERHEVVRALREKGREFTEDDKAALLAVQLEIVRSIPKEWKARQDSGSVELTATPYYHPILPLVCDTDSARIALPHVGLPPRMRAPDDAHEHVRRARELFARTFGRPPDGMWPAEGSVSPEALAVLAAEGVSWVASDEEVLMRSLPAGADRVRSLYRSWRVAAGEREIDMVFRDRGLSDLIGFTYARVFPRQAVDDFLGHLSRIAEAAHDGEPPLVAVILDGENPWESYPESGRDFLGELFGRLAQREAGIVTTTIGDRLRRHPPAGDRLARIHTGSWIEASFRIWMGHEEDVSAWTLVGEAKRVLDGARQEGASAEALAAAREHLLSAQASDWYWWYGPDFVTENAAEFDQLFRGHVQAVYRALGREPPPRTFQPISRGARRAGADAWVREPVGFIHPRVDGERGSWLRWQGAGLYRADLAPGGAMFQGDRAFAALHYGFDVSHLYLRLDPEGDDPAALAGRIDELHVALRCGDRVVDVGAPLTSAFVLRAESGRGPEVGQGRFRAIVTLVLPFAAVGLAPGDHVSIAVRGLRDGVEVERLPAVGFVTLDVPDEDFERHLWKV